MKNSAIVMSFFKNEVPAGSSRINLKWPDKHEATDFKLDQLGELVGCETETTTIPFEQINRNRPQCS
jgi:hypothetical protein